jgi:hypothetical protein
MSPNIVVLILHEYKFDCYTILSTGYGLDGPGIESRWGGGDFSHTSRPALRPTQPPVQ